MALPRRRNPSPSPSVSSIASDISTDLSSEEAEVRKYVKRLLSKRLFLGHYQERRYVESLQVYRDMVVLHKSETELQLNVNRTMSKLSSLYGDKKWLGMTSPDIIGAPAAGYCFWTKLQDVAFGFYWFQIRQVRYDEREIAVRLKVIRPVMEEVVTPSTAPTSFTKGFSDNFDALKTHIHSSIHSLKECNPTPSSPTSDSHKSSCPEPSKVIPEEKGKEEENVVTCKQVATEHLKLEDVTSLCQTIVYNWREILMFMTMAFVGALHGFGKCVEYVGNFSLKFMHEITNLLRTITPIVLAVIELVGKLVGGLYLLLAMIFRVGNGPLPPQQFRPPVQNRRPLAPIKYNNYPGRFT